MCSSCINIFKVCIFSGGSCFEYNSLAAIGNQFLMSLSAPVSVLVVVGLMSHIVKINHVLIQLLQYSGLSVVQHWAIIWRVVWVGLLSNGSSASDKVWCADGNCRMPTWPEVIVCSYPCPQVSFEFSGPRKVGNRTKRFNVKIAGLLCLHSSH